MGPMRSAFTLAEVLVAILVFSVGILGLASSGTMLLVQAREAQVLTGAAVLAGAVLDSLRARPCASVAPGSTTRGAVTATWTTVPSGPVLAVTTTISASGRSALRPLTIDTLLPCDR